MKKILLSIACITTLSCFSQTWTKISGIADGTDVKSLASINGKIMIAGQTSPTLIEFFTSVDGNTWSTAASYEFAGTFLWGLPQNNLLLSGTKVYNANNSWSAFNAGGGDGYAEFTNGTILSGPASFPGPLYTISSTGVAGTPTGANFQLGQKYCNGINNRLFILGLSMQYIDYLNLSTMVRPATFNGEPTTPILWDSFAFYDMVKTSNNNLFATNLNYGVVTSTDNGVSWTNVPEFSFPSSGGSLVKNSSDHLFTIASKTFSNGRIWKSTDGGITFTDITGNLAQGFAPTILYMNELNELFCFRNGNESGIYKFNPLVGIDENSLSTSVSLYPNPTNGNMSVELKTLNSAPTIVSITNVIGEVVLTSAETENNFTLKTDNLKSGVYFVNLNNAGKSTTKKIIVE